MLLKICSMNRSFRKPWKHLSMPMPCNLRWKKPSVHLDCSQSILKRFPRLLLRGGSRKKKQCGICLEDKYPSEFFDNKLCSHIFCSFCITQYIRIKLQENLVSIDCPEPDCTEHLTPEKCIAILPKQTIQQWSLALVEADIPLFQKFYCPFQDCSALLLKDIVPDESGSSSGAAAVAVVKKESECPACRRLFCAQCAVPWHTGLDCSELKSLSDSEKEKCDLMLLKLAKDNDWKRCARCKHIIERYSGCCHMICRCGYQFCYKCGSEWKKDGISCNCSG